MSISLYESIKLGFLDFLFRKLRSLITIIGIVLGTMSIIVILSIVKGMNDETLKWMNETGGLRKLSIQRDWQFNNPLKLPTFFTLKEFNYIKENIPEVDAYNATITQRASVSYGTNFTFTRLIGTLEDFEKTEEWSVSEGRFIKQFDFRESNDVIVLGSTIKNEIFGNKNAVGQYVTLRDKRLKVIGVMQHRQMSGGVGFMGENPLEYLNRTSIVPLSTMINKLRADDVIESITIRAFDEKQPRILKPELDDLLLNLRRGQAVFSVYSAIEQAENSKENSKMFQIVFFFISLVSLLVGGIVIMNIMLATIQERTREIGIRLAVGARQRDILIQFLVQTVVITFIGGIFGVISAFLIIDFVGNFLKISTKLDISMVFIALGVSVIVGLFFGIYPAIKASKLDPVKALRYE